MSKFSDDVFENRDIFEDITSSDYYFNSYAHFGMFKNIIFKYQINNKQIMLKRYSWGNKQ